MVVAGNDQAVRAGARVLGDGGNAVDAAVATALALGVVEPSQSGIGGRTQILVGLPDGTFHGIDATTQIPLGYDAATAPTVERGYATVAIPGTVRGLARLLEAHGTLTWAEAVQPAVRLARDGFELSEGEAGRLRENLDVLRRDPALAALYLRPNGAPAAAGDTVVNDALARTLATLAEEGAGSFYTGSLARRMVEDLDGHGGFVTASDLAGYEAVDVPVGTGRYRDLDLAGTWLPASGVTTIEILQILDRFDFASMDPAHRPAVVAQALLAGFRDREQAQHEPPERAVARLTSPALARERAREIRLPGGAAAKGAGPGARPLAPDPVPDHTTHVSVVDRSGMVVAMTQSLGPSWGSGVATPGLGFPYAATLGGYLAELGPGGRAWSSQSPLLGYRDGEPVLVIGGGGARRIISAIVTTVTRLIDDGLPMEEALAGPRLHPSGGTVTLESGRTPSWTAGTATALESVGFQVESMASGTWFARLNAVGRDADGGWKGVADPRWPWGMASGPGS